jgi:hypothetical protein
MISYLEVDDDDDDDDDRGNYFIMRNFIIWTLHHIIRPI